MEYFIKIIRPSQSVLLFWFGSGQGSWLCGGMYMYYYIIILDYIQIIYYYIKKIIQHLDLRYLIWISDFSTWFFLPTTEFQVHLFLRFESEVWHGTAGLHPTEEGAPGPRTEVSRSSYHLRLYRHHCYNNNRLTFEIHLILYSITVLHFSAVCFFIAL